MASPACPYVPVTSGHLQCTDTFAWSRGCPFMTGTTVASSYLPVIHIRITNAHQPFSQILATVVIIAENVVHDAVGIAMISKTTQQCGYRQTRTHVTGSRVDSNMATVNHDYTMGVVLQSATTSLSEDKCVYERIHMRNLFCRHAQSFISTCSLCFATSFITP